MRAKDFFPVLGMSAFFGATFSAAILKSGRL